MLYSNISPHALRVTCCMKVSNPMKPIALALSAILVLAVAACVAPVAPPAVAPPPTQPPAISPTPLPPTAEPTPTAVIDVPPSQVEPPVSSGQSEIADLAVQFAAAELGVDPANIQVIGVEPVDWRNSCLGVEKPGEMCLEVITPGYRVVLEIDGQQVYVHSNESGDVMRLTSDSQVPPSSRPVSGGWTTTL